MFCLLLIKLDFYHNGTCFSGFFEKMSNINFQKNNNLPQNQKMPSFNKNFELGWY